MLDVSATMSLHWTIIAGFLYAEIGFMMALLIPFISTRMWHRVSNYLQYYRYRYLIHRYRFIGNNDTRYRYLL